MKMNLKFPLIAMAAIALAATPAVAQQPQQAANNAECVNGTAPKGRPDKAPKFNPFDGLNLTEQQQTAINNLQNERRQACAAAAKAKKEQKADKQKAKADKQKGDKQKEDPKQKAEQRKASRQEYLAKVKSILTPEQYTKYLENVYVNAAPAHGNKDAKKGGDRPGQRGPRGDRGQRPNRR